MSPKTDGAQSITKAALLLRALSTFGSLGASLMQISQLTGLPKATAHRILATLGEERLVERPTGTRHYRIGPDIFAFGIGAQHALDLPSLTRPSLERLSSSTGLTVYLGVRSGYDMLCLDKATGTQVASELLLEVSDRWPIGIGSFSLALLAFLPAAQVHEVIDFNQRRVSEEDTLTFKHIQRSILKTQRNGYATRSMRTRGGLSGVAVPIFDDRRYPIGTLCAVFEVQQQSASYSADLAKALQRESSLITSLYEARQLQQQQQEKWRLAVRGQAHNRMLS
jgi:DNA-binding IclR family transcriptional regulator